MPADLNLIRAAFCQRTYFYRGHCRLRMLESGISEENVEAAICEDEPVIVEDYPLDTRGPAALVLGWPRPNWPLHILVGYGETPDVALDAITVYEPSTVEWHNNFRVRRP